MKTFLSLLPKISTILLTLLLSILSGFSSAQLVVNSVTTSPSTCANNGSITVSATTTNPPLLCSIVSGPLAQPVQTAPVFNSLPPGTYTLNISDAAGNHQLQTATIAGNYATVNFTTATTAPLCDGSSDGSITGLNVPGTGLAPFTWQLIAPSTVVMPAQSGNTFNNLPAGNYTMRVTDACNNLRTVVLSLQDPNTSMQMYGTLSAEKIGCDTMLISSLLQVNELRLPFSYHYQTSNGTFIPTSGTTIDSSLLHVNNTITITQVIPGLTYGDYIQATITNACGDQVTSSVLSTYPFVFYPQYSYNGCGNSVTPFFENPPGQFWNYHTFLEQPVSYTFTNTTTGVVFSDTIMGNYSIAGVSVQPPVPAGETYNLVITDGCGQTFAHTYTIPGPAAPHITGTAIIAQACIDSVAGTYRISTVGFGSGAQLIMISGPSTLGSTTPEYEYSDTYTYPDTIPGDDYFFVSNLAVGTYHYKIIDECGNEIPSSFTITPQQVTNLDRDVSFKKGCPGENTIYFYMQGQGKVTIRDILNDTIIEEHQFYYYGGPGTQDSLLHVPSGPYEITYEYEHSQQSQLNDSNIPCALIVDTIVIPPYEFPFISTSNSILCSGSIYMELIPDTTKGVGPYQYEVIAGPETFPLQDENAFEVNIPGTYTVRIIDACGNASARNITVSEIEFTPPEAHTDCNDTRIVFPSSDYYTYVWTAPDQSVFIADSLVLQPVTPGDTGIYTIDRIVNISGCTDTTTLSYHITLNNFLNQVIAFCEGTSVTVGTHTYTLPGIYHDTLTTLSGCDSLVLTTITILPQVTDTTLTTICLGDSVEVAGIYYTLPGFYTDSVQNSGGCYDLLVTNLRVQGIPDTIDVSICPDGSYTVGANHYTLPGTYQDTLISSLGCDSVVVLNLSVRPYGQRTLTQTICQGGSFTVGTHTYTLSGTYSDTLVTAGCDSIVTLNLTVLPYLQHTITTSICEGESYASGGNSYSVSGTYTDTLATAACDSIVTLNLTVLPLQYYTYNAAICANESYSFGETALTQSGTYTHAFPTSGCDSIVTLHLTVYPAVSVSIHSSAFEINEGALVQLNALSSTQPLDYLWSGGMDFSNPAIGNPTAVIEHSAFVMITVTDTNGCTATDQLTVAFPQTSTLYIPNSFTPDNDEFNQVFRVSYTNINEFSMLIFDRWGEIIFESYDINAGWDGTYHGKIVQDGAYVYRVTAIGMDAVVYDLTGHVIVLR